ncbi:hypothetical protein GOODEAATRI_032935 [Goodea atripinnis]|uniref:Uncharacterized protein n=1 Tax=Goodea atripinnis TaxID=208336 RepID=A0ABV0MX54_9TELE
MEKIHNIDCKFYGRRNEKPSLGTQSCTRKCSPELTYNIGMDSLATEREWQDMRIIGDLEANQCRVKNFSDDNIHQEDTNRKKTLQDNLIDLRHRFQQEYLSVCHEVNLTT